MKKHEVRFKLLMALLDEGYAADNVLRTVDSRVAFINKCITEMLEEGYIKTGKRIVKGNRKGKHKVKDIQFSYKKITSKGVQWLIDNYSDEYLWLKYLPNPMIDFRINKPHATNRSVYRQMKSTTASIMFKNLGIKTFNKVTNTQEETLKEIVSNAREQYRIDNGIITENLYRDRKGQSMMYYHSKDLKNLMSLDKKEVQQFMFPSYHGLLIFRLHSYLIYVTKSKGISMRYDTIKRIKLSLDHFIKFNHTIDERYDTLKRAIVFCKNEKEFADTFFRIYKDNKDVSNKKLEKSLSNSFFNLYAVPVSLKGQKLLYDILKLGDNYRDIVVEKLKESGVRCEDYYHKIYIEGERTLIGTSLDLVDLERIYECIEQEIDERYMVVCYKWQERYYRRVLPDNVEYLFVPDDFLS